MTTVNTSDEKILKSEILDWVLVEEAGAVKVYDKIAGLKNLGKTFFAFEKEIHEKAVWAEAQMIKKYGDEIYGKSAQMAGQGTAGRASPLISCTVSKLMVLSESIVSEAADSYDEFIKDFQEFERVINKKATDWTWKNQHIDGIAKFNQVKGKFKKGDAASNARAWKEISEFLNKEPWKTDMEKDNEFKTVFQKLKQEGGTFAQQAADAQDQQKNGIGAVGDIRLSDKDGPWNPKQAYRIDIRTNFDENWFKRKYKSGLLNKMIDVIKTDAYAHVSPDVKRGNPYHTFSADQMEPGDKRKLDKIQWNMTNKVTKDYINFLLGWTRQTVKQTKDESVVPVGELQRDDKFGMQMAEKALDDRGFLGRLKQKLFAGGQSNNVVSVAFQLADPNDRGWEEDPNGQTDNSGTGGQQGGSTEKGDNGQGANGKKENGDQSANGPTDIRARIERIEKIMTKNNLWGDLNPEDQKKETNESSGEPFSEDDFKPMPINQTVRGLCEGAVGVESLIDGFLCEG